MREIGYEREDVRKADLNLSSSVRASFVILLTCNRAEIYYYGDDVTATLFSRALRLNPLDVLPYFEKREGDEAVKYLFELSSGLLSPYFGEEVISGQIARAMEEARASGVINAELDLLFRSALNFSKKVHSKLKVRVIDREEIEEVCRLVKGRRVLVTGSGEKARAIAKLLSAQGKEVIETVRDVEKADFLIPSGVRAVPYDERKKYLSTVDVLISASSGIGYTYEKSDLEPFNLQLFDLATPSDLPLDLEAVRTLSCPTPLKDEVTLTIGQMAAEALEVFNAELKKKEMLPYVEALAINAASSLVRKERKNLKLDENRDLAEKLYEECRKSVISAFYKSGWQF